MMMIWERYFLKQFLRMFALFLFCFYGFYILIDYASHTGTFSHHQIQIPWYEIARYYFFVFSSRAEILLPLALLIAFVQTVCSLNSHQELMALMASGFKLKLLMRPFLMMGLIGVIILYLNEQFILPEALTRLRRIENSTKHQKKNHSLPVIVHHVVLEDGSLFLYQEYDVEKKRFFDTFWIQSINDIYRIKYLFPTSIPTGHFVDHLNRQANGEFLQIAEYKELSFPKLQFNTELLQSNIIDADILSISELATQTRNLSSQINEKESKLLTAFYWKLMIPWLCLLAILAPAPFCVKFSRQLPVFLIYVVSLFGLIAFYMFLDASQVIAKRQVFFPFWTICSPFLISFSYFFWRFVKMT